MLKIASPRELQAELKAIIAFIHHSEKPDREVVASKLRALADRVAATLDLKTLKVGDKVKDPTGRMSKNPGVVKTVTGRFVIIQWGVVEQRLHFAKDKNHGLVKIAGVPEEPTTSYDRTAAIKVPDELIDVMKPSVRKMESILKSKAHKKFESIEGLETNYVSNGELIVNFWGPKTRGTRSPTPNEPKGRYFVYLQMASEDTVDIEVQRWPWKKGVIDMRSGPKVKKKGISLDDAASVTEQLLGQVAGK